MCVCKPRVHQRERKVSTFAIENDICPNCHQASERSYMQRSREHIIEFLRSLLEVIASNVLNLLVSWRFHRTDFLTSIQIFDDLIDTSKTSRVALLISWDSGNSTQSKNYSLERRLCELQCKTIRLSTVLSQMSIIRELQALIQCFTNYLNEMKI